MDNDHLDVKRKLIEFQTAQLNVDNKTLLTEIYSIAIATCFAINSELLRAIERLLNSSTPTRAIEEYVEY